MKYPLAVLALLAVSAPMRADSVSSPYGPLYYPSGATVTSISNNAFPYSEPGVWGLYYSFADGTGQTYAPGDDGDVGYIDFSTPITSITFDYTWDNTSPFDVTFYNLNHAPFETFSDSATSGTETFTFDTSVTELQWIGQDASWGEGGITSLSYTLDGPVATPEPGSLLLTVLGLAFVGVAFAWRVCIRAKP
jgi:hypothetical protein